MQDGQLAVITLWMVPNYEGVVVQRWGDDLVQLGRIAGDSWPGIFANVGLHLERNRVRILPPGTKLEI